MTRASPADQTRPVILVTPPWLAQRLRRHLRHLSRKLCRGSLDRWTCRENRVKFLSFKVLPNLIAKHHEDYVFQEALLVVHGLGLYLEGEWRLKVLHFFWSSFGSKQWQGVPTGWLFACLLVCFCWCVYSVQTFEWKYEETIASQCCKLRTSSTSSRVHMPLLDFCARISYNQLSLW